MNKVLAEGYPLGDGEAEEIEQKKENQRTHQQNH